MEADNEVSHWGQSQPNVQENAGKSKKRGPRKPKRIYEGLNEEEFIKLLKATRHVYKNPDKIKNKKAERRCELHRIIFLLSFGSGLRISEVLSLQPEDIDFKAKKIFIRQGKGSKDRVTFLTKLFREKYLKYLPIKIQKRAVEAVFQRNTMKCGINRPIGSFLRAGKEIPIFRFHLHCLRHGFALRCLDSGMPLHQLQILMGHENIATTSRYLKSNPSDAIESAMEAGL